METNKPFKNIQSNTNKQVKEINKTMKDQEVEIGAIKKTQTDGILELENLGKRIGTMDASITKRIQEMEERISGIEATIQEINLSKNGKSKKFLTQNILEICDIIK